MPYQYDAAGRRTRTTWPGSSFFVAYAWNVAGDLTQICENNATCASGVLATYAYDNLGRRTSLTHMGGGATSYGYDGASRISSLALNPAGTAQDQTFGFAYSPASQIVSQTASNAAYDWAPAGAFSNSYAHNGLNQTTAAGSLTPTYGLAGSMNNDGTKGIGYDAHSRLRSTTTGAAYDYDPLDRLYQTTVGGATTRFLYDGADVIGEYDGSGNLQHRYVHGPGLDEPVVWYQGSGTTNRSFLFADVRGSIVAVTSGAGTTINKYDVYGAPSPAAAPRPGVRR